MIKFFVRWQGFWGSSEAVCGAEKQPFIGCTGKKRRHSKWRTNLCSKYQSPKALEPLKVPKIQNVKHLPEAVVKTKLTSSQNPKNDQTSNQELLEASWNGQLPTWLPADALRKLKASAVYGGVLGAHPGNSGPASLTLTIFMTKHKQEKGKEKLKPTAKKTD